MAVSKRLRYEVLRRDNHTCRYCGASAPDVALRVDHVTPVALGGSDNPSNLATSCEPCNSGKTSSTPDASLVADVSGDALRWAAAMKQAAENLKEQQRPKVAYRKAFEKSWSGWTKQDGWKTAAVDLPNGWKGSLDAFYEAGLPQEVWPDIIEKAMTNPTVRADNVFRYCCGIAWRMVRELQERAKALIAPPLESPKTELTALGQAAVEAWARSWTSEHEAAPTAEARDGFARSVADFLVRNDMLDPERLIEAATYGPQAQASTFEESLAALLDQERADIVIEWSDAWAGLGGATQLRDLPDSFLYNVVQGQVDQLDECGVSPDRIRRAAILAGYHHSSELHHGLRDAELSQVGVVGYRHMAADLWSRSFHATANRWPEPEERGAFMRHIDRVIEDAEFYVNDLLVAAVSASAYQDPDLSTCLSRHLSVFEAAARPLQGAAS
jgi:hypothetical protein